MNTIHRSDYVNDFCLSGPIIFYGATNTLENSQTGASTSISSVCARLLIFLRKHPNVLVSRKELIDAVWSDYGFVVSTNSLNQAICALRAALGEIGVDNVGIKTVPRIGYCLLIGICDPHG